MPLLGFLRQNSKQLEWASQRSNIFGVRWPRKWHSKITVKDKEPERTIEKKYSTGAVDVCLSIGHHCPETCIDNSASCTTSTTNDDRTFSIDDA
jgi:hypothetical protein